LSDAPLVSPDDQGATFVELFFDLVFVFAVTRVTHQLAHHLSWGAVGATVVVFWLIWWAWTQFTWALNASNTNRHDVRLVTLIATGVAFLMAASVDYAFSDGAAWFAVPYVVVRVLGLGLYLRVGRHDAQIMAGVRAFALASLPGLAAVLFGVFLDPAQRMWVWTGACLFDVGAAWASGRHRTWHLRIEHFAERHALFVIIALGESLIVAGSAIADAPRTGQLLMTGTLAAGATCLLWWTYFGWAKDALEYGIAHTPDDRQVHVARDAFTLGHFPLIFGVVSFAVGIEGLVGSAGESSPARAYALAAGLVLFVGSTAVALRRATGVLPVPRVVILAATAVAICLCAGSSPVLLFVVASGGLAAIIVVEQRRPPSCKLANPVGRAPMA